MYQEIEIKLIKNLAIVLIVLGFLFVVTIPPKTPQTVVSPIKPKTHLFRAFSNLAEKKRVVYGYLPWWSLEDLEYIQLDKLTDIAYFGVYLNSDGNFKKATEEGLLEPGYNRWVDSPKLSEFITKAKKYNVNVALTLIAHEDDVTDKFLECKPCWENVAKNLKSEMDKHSITSLNLNFEYGGGTTKQKADQYVEFVDYINKYMDKQYKDSFVVTSAFADSADGDRVSSNIEGLGKVADGIFIMGYDFHGPQSANAGPVAPMDEISKTVDTFLSYSNNNKIILGVPYYGYNWVVDSNTFGATRIEGNDNIGYSQSQMYASVLDTLQDVNAQVSWNDVSKTPYFSYISTETGSLRQVHYENTESLKEKYKLIKDKKLLGVGIWALGYDSGRTELWDLLETEFWSY